MTTAPAKIQAGETWAKKKSDGTVTLYLVVKADPRGSLTLQNIATPSSVFKTTTDRMLASGYFLVSQTPYVNLACNKSKRKAALPSPHRCPFTVDFLEGRADFQVPTVR